MMCVKVRGFLQLPGLVLNKHCTLSSPAKVVGICTFDEKIARRAVQVASLYSFLPRLEHHVQQFDLGSSSLLRSNLAIVPITSS